MNRDKLVLIIVDGSVKAKGWRLQLVHSRKLTNMTISPALFLALTVTVVRDKKKRTVLRSNQIAGLVTVPFWKKNNRVSLRCIFILRKLSWSLPFINLYSKEHRFNTLLNQSKLGNSWTSFLGNEIYEISPRVMITLRIDVYSLSNGDAVMF